MNKVSKTHNVALTVDDNGKFLAASTAKPFFLLVADSKEEALAKAQRALNFYHQLDLATVSACLPCKGSSFVTYEQHELQAA